MPNATMLRKILFTQRYVKVGNMLNSDRFTTHTLSGEIPIVGR